MNASSVCIYACNTMWHNVMRSDVVSRNVMCAAVVSRNVMCAVCAGSSSHSSSKSPPVPPPDLLTNPDEIPWWNPLLQSPAEIPCWNHLPKSSDEIFWWKPLLALTMKISLLQHLCVLTNPQPEGLICFYKCNNTGTSTCIFCNAEISKYSFRV